MNMTDRSKYKNKHFSENYERIYIAVPKGVKDVVKSLAKNRNLSVNAYFQYLVRQDQEGMFDTMQIAEKNRKKISGIIGNLHDGYDITFIDGTKFHCKTKKEIRKSIIDYCGE